MVITQLNVCHMLLKIQFIDNGFLLKTIIRQHGVKK